VRVTPGYSADKQQVLARLKRTERQVRGLQCPIDKDTYCIDALTQEVAAVGKASACTCWTSDSNTALPALPPAATPNAPTTCSMKQPRQSSDCAEPEENEMNTLTFTVPGMTCGHCEAAVKGEVGKVAGVSDVAVDLVTKLVTVSGSTLDTTAIVAALDEAGFEAATAG